jgi:AcrR family transcriptional regulator
MARVVKAEEFAAKRNQILDAAQRLIYSKGYERMSIQDILDQLQISKGAFYHYFDSKPALLEALIERMQQQIEQSLLPSIHDPRLSALEKLQLYFAALDRSRTEKKAFIADLARVWFADDNAIVREKVNAATIERRAPLLNEIVRQGISEGVFTTRFPDKAGEIILSLAQGMSNALVKLMVSYEHERDHRRGIEEMVTTYAAYTDALEHMLGAPSGILYRPNAEAVKEWLEQS